MLHFLSNGNYLSILWVLSKISCGLCGFCPYHTHLSILYRHLLCLYHEPFCSFSHNSHSCSQLAHLFLLYELLSSPRHEPLPFIPRMFIHIHTLHIFVCTLETFCLCKGLHQSTILHTTIDLIPLVMKIDILESLLVSSNIVC
jgi:hypothetical protein